MSGQQEQNRIKALKLRNIASSEADLINKSLGLVGQRHKVVKEYEPEANAPLTEHLKFQNSLQQASNHDHFFLEKLEKAVVAKKKCVSEISANAQLEINSKLSLIKVLLKEIKT